MLSIYTFVGFLIVDVLSDLQLLLPRDALNHPGRRKNSLILPAEGPYSRIPNNEFQLDDLNSDGSPKKPTKKDHGPPKAYKKIGRLLAKNRPSIKKAQKIAWSKSGSISGNKVAKGHGGVGKKAINRQGFPDNFGFNGYGELAGNFGFDRYSDYGLPCDGIARDAPECAPNDGTWNGPEDPWNGPQEPSSGMEGRQEANTGDGNVDGPGEQGGNGEVGPSADDGAGLQGLWNDLANGQGEYSYPDNTGVAGPGEQVGNIEIGGNAEDAPPPPGMINLGSNGQGDPSVTILGNGADVGNGGMAGKTPHVAIKIYIYRPPE